MTSEVVCSVAPSRGKEKQLDLCFQDTFILMSSAEFESPAILQEDLTTCKPVSAAAARSVAWAAETQPTTGGTGGVSGGGGGGGNHQNAHLGHSSEQPARPPGEAGGAAPGGAAGAAGGDDPRGGGGNNDSSHGADQDDESHELNSGESSSTSSGSVQVLIAVPNPELMLPQPDENQHHNNNNNNNNNHHDLGSHSEGSGISEATTAVVSDTDALGQDAIRFDPSTCGMPSTVNISAVHPVSIAVRDVIKSSSENLDANSTATSTLSSFTASSSSGKDEKKGLSVTDGSIAFETSKLDISCTSEPIDSSHEASKQTTSDEKLVEFHISQEDMFVCADDRFTSTPSETVAILGFSREPIAGTDINDEESEMIIPPSPDECQSVVPFLIPGTPSTIAPEVSHSSELQEMEIECETVKQNENVKWPITEDNATSSQQKTTQEVPEIAEENLQKKIEVSNDANLEKDTADSIEKKSSERAVAATKIGQYLVKSLQKEADAEPSTSHDILADDQQITSKVSLPMSSCELLSDPTSDSAKISETAVRKITFESESQSSHPSSLDPIKHTNSSESDTPLSLSKTSIDTRDSFSVGQTVIRQECSAPCPEIMQLLQEINSLEHSANSSKAADPMISGQSVVSIPCKLTKDDDICDNVGLELQKSDHSSSNGTKYDTMDCSTNKLTDKRVVSEVDDETSCKPLISRDSEESQDGNNDLMLRYSPSQNAESQYFHLEAEDEEVVQSEVPEIIPESEDSVSEIPTREKLTVDDMEKVPSREHTVDCTSDSDKEKSKSDLTVSTEMPTKESTKEKLIDEVVNEKSCLNVEDIHLNDESESSCNGTSMPAFHLNPSKVIASLECDVLEKPKFSPEKEKTKILPDKPELSSNSHLHHEDYDDNAYNPFESCNTESCESNLLQQQQQQQQQQTLDDVSANDEPDAPICPVGRYKRRRYMSDDNEVQEQSLESKKEEKKCSKSASCQVDLGCIAPSCSSPVTAEGDRRHTATQANYTRDQATQTMPDESEVKKIVTIPKDSKDGRNILRHTLIIKRIVIQEVLCQGKVIKRSVEEAVEEPVITEFGSGEEGKPMETCLHPTPSDKISPESLGALKSSNSSSLSKSTSSTSGTSACLADISSSKSSSSSSVMRLPSTTTPNLPSSHGPNHSSYTNSILPAQSSSLCISHVEVTDATPQASFQVEQKVGISGMKTLRSVKRRQRFEIRKSLNLSSPEDKSSPPKSTTTPQVSATKDNKQNVESRIQPCATPPKRIHKPKEKKKAVTPQESKGNTILAESPVKRSGKKTKRSHDASGKRHSSDSNNVSPKKVALPRDTCASARDQCSMLSPSFHHLSSPYASYNQDSSSMKPGVRVMAKWRDGFYYPGRVVQPEKDDRWQIQYDDGDDIRSIKIGSILVVDVLPVGQSIYAKSPDDYFDSGIIIDHYNENDEAGYIVEIDGGVLRRVPQAEVILTHDQASCLKDLPGSTMHGYTSICLDNIIEGTRRSRETSLCSTPRSQQPRSPHTPKRMRITGEGVASTSKLGPDVQHYDSEDSSPSKKASKGTK